MLLPFQSSHALMYLDMKRKLRIIESGAALPLLGMVNLRFGCYILFPLKYNKYKLLIT